MPSRSRVLPGAYWLLQRSRSAKVVLSLSADALMVPFALWLAFALKFDSIVEGFTRHPGLYVGVAISAVVTAAICGLYRTVLRYVDFRILAPAVVGTLVSTLVLYILGETIAQRSFPLSLLAIYALVCWSGMTGVRVVMHILLLPRKSRREAVVIYGAGEAGAELAKALVSGDQYELVAYVDEKRSMCGTTVCGVPVVTPEQLDSILKAYEVKRILLAIPSASRARRARVIHRLEAMGAHIQTVPNLEDIVAGHAKIDDLREVDVNDLLGRDVVPPNQQLLDACIRGKNVLVTGAGGSIGSEPHYTR